MRRAKDPASKNPLPAAPAGEPGGSRRLDGRGEEVAGDDEDGDGDDEDGDDGKNDDETAASAAALEIDPPGGAERPDDELREVLLPGEGVRRAVSRRGEAHGDEAHGDEARTNEARSGHPRRDHPRRRDLRGDELRGDDSGRDDLRRNELRSDELRSDDSAGDDSASVDSGSDELRDELLVPADPRTPAQASAGVTGVEAVAQMQGPGPGDLLTDEELVRAATALVFASPEPISLRRLVDLLERPDPTRVEAALAVLGDRLAQSALGLELRRIAGGYQILTVPEMGSVIQRLHKARRAERISAAALETLAVVAYRQPVTKAEIEAIRGVQAGPILRTLVERGLVRVTGRADVPGHPLQYATTREFLDRFGLGDLDELPRDAELSKD